MVAARLEVRVEDGRAVAVVARRGRTVWAAETTWQSPADLVEALATLAAERPPGVRSAMVTLAPGVGRTKAVSGLPRLRRRDLADHVRLNTRRYFLQNGVPLVADAHAREGVTLMAAAPVPVVSAICEGLSAAGLRCTDIVPDGVPGLSLLPDGARAVRRDDARRRLVRWWAGAAVAALLAALAWVGSLARARATAQAELAVLDPALEQALQARRDLDATTEAIFVLAEANRRRTSAAALMAAVATALPDSAFLTALHLERDGTVRMAGYAAGASRVLAALAAARLLRDARFEGSVTREAFAGRDWERFTLRGRLAGDGAESPR